MTTQASRHASHPSVPGAGPQRQCGHGQYREGGAAKHTATIKPANTTLWSDVRPEVRIRPGQMHVFALWAPLVPEATRALGQISAYIREGTLETGQHPTIERLAELRNAVGRSDDHDVLMALQYVRRTLRRALVLRGPTGRWKP